MLTRLGKALVSVIAVACLLSAAAVATTLPRSSRRSRSAASARQAGARVKRSARQHCSPAKRARVHGHPATGPRRSPCRAKATKARAKTKGPIAYADGAPVKRRHPGARASAAPTSWSSSASHISTWAFDDCANGGSSASAGLVRAWVSYAESNCGPGGDAKALSDCHSAQTTYCDVIQYLDTNWMYPDGSPTWPEFSGAAAEDWYQHLPGSASSRIQSGGNNGGYLVNQANPAVQNFFAAYARTNYDNADGLMMDDQSSNLDSQLWYSTCGCGASAETASNAALVSAHEAMSAAMTHTSGQPFTQIDNTLPPNPSLPQGFNLLNRSTGVDGLIGEGEPESDGTLDPYYSTLLDQIAYVADETNSFVVPLSYAPAGASYQSQTRRVQEATMLLGYSPGHLVDWADLETGSSDLAVWPEEGIYPTEPVQSMGSPGGSGCLAGSGQVCSTGGHNDLQVAPGVYRREFGACYAQNAAFGACATIVNTTSSPVTVRSGWLTRSYGHEIAFTGGDVQSGGQLSLDGSRFTAGSTSVPAHDAALMAR